MNESDINKNKKSSRRVESRLQRYVERKVFSASAAAATVSSGGASGSLCNIPQGSDIANRIGRHIRALYLDICFNTYYNGGVNTAGDTVALFIYIDTSASAGTPLSTDMVDTAVTGFGVGLLNASKYSKRFVPLAIVDMPVGPGGPDSVTFRKRIQIPAKYSVFEYLASTTAYPITNALVMAWGDQNSNTAISYNWNAQLFFEDM
jgi:hypothetical protein